MSINNIFFPCCFSKNLYHFGKNNLEHQKYQCKEGNRQFSANSKPDDSKHSYPKCPICNLETIYVMAIFTILDLNVILENVTLFIL